MFPNSLKFLKKHVISFLQTSFGSWWSCGTTRTTAASASSSTAASTPATLSSSTMRRAAAQSAPSSSTSRASPSQAPSSTSPTSCTAPSGQSWPSRDVIDKKSCLEIILKIVLGFNFDYVTCALSFPIFLL